MIVDRIFNFGKEGMAILFRPAKMSAKVYRIVVHERNGSVRLEKASQKLYNLTLQADKRH